MGRRNKNNLYFYYYNIQGININKVEHNINEFAEDTQLMNDADIKSFEKSIHVVNKLRTVSVCL